MHANARQLAITILCQRQETGQPVDLIRDQLLSQASLPDRKDIHLVTALVYGVLRRQRYLDAILRGFSSHPPAKMKNLTLQALRVGLLQLCCMDRIPPSAAINETVKALKEARQPQWLTGFVNGLLRAIARQADSTPGLWDDEDGTMAPAVRLSHPDWLYERWRARYGEEEARRICLVNNRQPPLVLRVNTGRLSREELLGRLLAAGISAAAGRYSPAAVVLADYRGEIEAIPGYAEGHFMVQDEGAQLISLMLAPLSEGVCLDACAGLGGKTSHLAGMLPASGRIIAIEPNGLRFRRLGENVQRLGLASVVTSRQTTLAGLPEKNTPPFQAILLDAPCSGLGVIRRHPDIRWNRRPEELARYAGQQFELLALAAEMLAPGGALVYATCSTEPEENEQVVAKFLADRPHFTLSLPPLFPPAAQQLINEKGFFQTLPAEAIDGFFAARLVRSKE
jgi:16S rRNA (cytosine967-C5)-methyltransferase